MTETNKKYSLTTQIFIAMFAGIIIGGFLQLVVFGESNDFVFSLAGSEISTKTFLVDGVFNVGGTIFVNLLKMLVVPLVLVSLVCGVCGLSDPSKLGRLGGKSVALYIFTTFIAVTVALVAAMLIGPGEGFTIPSDTSEFVPKPTPALAQVIIDIFPSNPFDSMSQGNMLQIIVFAILFGLAITKAGELGQKVKRAFEAVNEVVMQVVMIIMKLAPIGVFCLIAKLFSTISLGDIGKIAAYFFLVLTLLILHAAITYPIILTTLARLNPIMMLSKLRNTMVFAVSSSSSSATLPLTMATARKRLGVSRSVSSFTLPLGATINMDGTAIMQGVATVFIAQVYGVDLTVTQLLMVVLTATLASIGTAGVPGVGLIMLAMVLQQVNLPVEGIALIIGIDRPLDMVRTVVNVTGDTTVACVVAKSEGELDIDAYNDASLINSPLEES